MEGVKDRFPRPPLTGWWKLNKKGKPHKNLNTVRIQRRKRLEEQYEVLNQLRLIYFLRPENNAQGEPGEVRKFLATIGFGSASNADAELMEYILARNEFTKIVNASKASELQKREVLADYHVRMYRHFSMPQAFYLSRQGKNPKAVNLDKLIKKVVEFQAFELKKKEVETEVTPVLSYADLLESSLMRGKSGLSKSHGLKLLKEARARAAKWDSPGSKSLPFDDKVLAKNLYGKVNSFTLAQVRQDRNRLRKYGFL